MMNSRLTGRKIATVGIAVLSCFFYAAVLDLSHSDAVADNVVVIDPRDGQKYRTVVMGGKTWMAQNLNFEPQLSGNSWCYNNNISNCEQFGRLYDWNTAMNVCPPGWHLPDRSDWNALIAAAGSVAKLKSSPPDWNGTDTFGFSALPAGGRRVNNTFMHIGSQGYWWVAAGFSVQSAYVQNMNGTYMDEKAHNKLLGFSVRCVMDI